MRGSLLWILAGFAAWLASRVTGGWSVPFAAGAFWVGALLLMCLIGLLLDRLSPTASAAWRQAIMVPRSDCAAPAPVEAVADTTAPGQWLAAGPSSVVSQTQPTMKADGRAGWYTHLADLGIYFNERYPRQGICDTVTWLLRSGDVLLLLFVPEGDGGQAHHHCDFLGPDDAACRSIQVHAKVELRVPIAKTGLYVLGIGECGYGSVDFGTITAWLQVPDADRLRLSNAPQLLAGYGHQRGDNGVLKVEICDEDESPLLARDDSVAIDTLPLGAILVFDPETMQWDAASVPDPASSWRHEYQHQFRWYLQLCQGDVLAMEYVWRDTLLGQNIEFADATGFTSGGLELTGFVRTPTVFSSDGGRGLERFVCQQDGFHVVQLEMHGPPEWRGRPSQHFVALRLWGLRLQRPSALRDFALAPAWIEHWHQRLAPVPHAVMAEPLADDDAGRKGESST